MNSHTIHQHPNLSTPNVDLVPEPPKFEPFVQLLRGGLQKLRQAHKLTAHQERLLVELVGEANYLSHSITGFTIKGWAEYLAESHHTTRKSLARLLDAGLIVCDAGDAFGLYRQQAGFVVTITNDTWQVLVKPKRKKPSDVVVDNSKPRADVTTSKTQPRADVTTRWSDLPSRPAQTGTQIIDKELCATSGASQATPGGLASESPTCAAQTDLIVSQLEQAFPGAKLSTIVATVAMARGEGITDVTLTKATEAAIKADATSIKAWWLPRARSLHDRQANYQNRNQPGSQTNQPTAPAIKQASPWCDRCYAESELTIPKTTCKHSQGLQIVTHQAPPKRENQPTRQPAPQFGIVTHSHSAQVAV